jgi:hypothetical protein
LEHGQALVSNLEESVAGLRGLVLDLGEKFEGERGRNLELEKRLQGLEKKFKEIGKNQDSERNIIGGNDEGGAGDTPLEKNPKDYEAKDPVSAKIKFLENQVEFLTKNLKINESYFIQKFKGLKSEL